MWRRDPALYGSDKRLVLTNEGRRAITINTIDVEFRHRDLVDVCVVLQHFALQLASQRRLPHAVGFRVHGRGGGMNTETSSDR